MWKWLAVAALIYGLLGAQAIISPRNLGMIHVLDLRELNRVWHEMPALPAHHDFTEPGPPPITWPEGPVDYIERASGNRALRWDPPAFGRQALLGLPVSIPDSQNAVLSISLRSDAEETVYVGVREDDGSVYLTELALTAQWQAHNLPLDQLKLSPQTTDENQALNPEQVTGLFIAVGNLAAERPGRGARPVRDRLKARQHSAIEIDDFGFYAPDQRPGPS
ncbi:hypothetical protein JW859_05665 [bacterium]|nr:hypothetical protein [bacterium]